MIGPTVLVLCMAVPAAAQPDRPVDALQRSQLILRIFHPSEILGPDEYQRLLSMRDRTQESGREEAPPSRTVLEARDLLRLGQAEGAIAHLEQAYRSGDRSADVAYLLAVLSAEDENPGRRRRALDLINEALRTEPGNPDYHLARAVIYIALTLEEYALRELDQLIEREPGRAEAYAVKGQLIVEGLTLFGRRQSGVFVGAVPGTRSEAERLLATAITLDDRNVRAPRWLSHLYLYEGEWVKAMPVLNRMARDDIKPALARLGQGMAFYYLGLYEDARRSFEAAERELGAEAGHLLRNPGWAMPIQAMGPPEPSAADSTAVAVFWASRDPLLSDEHELRSLEQMRRFAMVAWFFGVPRLGLEGWETLKGQIYLRYGTPPVWTAASSAKLHPWAFSGGRFDISQMSLPANAPGGANRTAGGFGGSVSTFPEEWMQYPGFRIPVGMGFVTGLQSFVTQNPPESPSVPCIDNTSLFIEHTHAVPELSSVAGLKAPVRLPLTCYRFPGAAEEWEIIPVADVDPNLKRSLLGGWGLGLSSKLFTCSLDLSTGLKQVLPAPLFVENTEWSALPYSREQYLLCGRPVALGSGDHLVSLELVGEGDRAWVARDTLSVPLITGGPILSDLVLAGRIERREDALLWPSAGVVARSGLLIAPRTDNTFLPGEPMYLYFEIAGLEKDDVGATDYTIALSVTEGEGGGLVEVIADLFRAAVGRTNEQRTVTTSWRWSGITTRTAESLRVVIPEPKLRAYRLTLRVTDHVAENSSEAATELQISNRLPPIGNSQHLP
jgi:tetratricopeptide (TPR) repeat protein